MFRSQTERQLSHNEVDAAFRTDVLKGLSVKPRAIPARWLYDRHGSALFDAITALPEYYPTRTERSILSSAIKEIASLTGPGRAIVEFGSGSSAKTPILLSEVDPVAYVPIDISGAYLKESAAALSHRFPELPIFPVKADFTRGLSLPAAINGAPRLGFFPGSTIGNLVVPAAVDLLRMMAATLGTGAMLLIGIDRIKNPDILLPAYDDAQGVTAAFNLNLLHRINRELAGSVPVDAFRHVARWNGVETRIEMHLEAIHDIRLAFRLVAGRDHPHREQHQVWPARRSPAAACRRLDSGLGVDRRERALFSHSRSSGSSTIGAVIGGGGCGDHACLLRGAIQQVHLNRHNRETAARSEMADNARGLGAAQNRFGVLACAYLHEPSFSIRSSSCL
jgi:L-histidine N-alpha-methyltransferase